MSDLLATGGAWLAGKLANHASRTVTYQRGADTASVAACITSSVLRIDNGIDALRIVRTDRDYVITTADLPFGTPLSGDTIIDTDGTFELLPYGDEPIYRPLDARGVMTLIHVKRIAS